MDHSHHDLPDVIMSTHDARRLEALLEGSGASAAASLLEAELLRARLVEPARMPPDVVTMHTRVRCVDETNGGAIDLQLVYPHEADAAAGRISVLAPVGSALLGLAVGRSITWPLPGGRTTRLRVDAIAYQPEAHGRLD